jgi:hypothetical protein
MGRRPLPAVRDLTRDGRWSIYTMYVYSRKWGEDAHRQTGHSLKLPSTTKVARLGHFPPASRPGVLCICLFSGCTSPESVATYTVCSSSLFWSPKLGNDNGKTELQPTQTINLQHPTVNIRETATNNNRRQRQLPDSLQSVLDN